MKSGENHSVNQEIRIKTSMLRSDLCNFSDGYIVVKGNAKRNKAVAFKNNSPLSTVFQKLME